MSRYRQSFIGFFLLWMSFMLFAGQSQIIYRSFWQPVYHGAYLNYCIIGSNQCGLPVATRYCQLMGYERANKAIEAHNVGLTHYIDARAICQGWRCNGFKTIQCVGKITHVPPKPYHYRKKKFVFPRFNRYRVDWCYDGDKGCGARAAFSFCRRLGYMSAHSYHMQKMVPATKAIGNQKLCFGESCRAFSEIICFR